MYWSLDDQNSACNHRNIEMDCIHFGFDLHVITWLWIYCRFYYYVDQSRNSSIV